MSANPIETLDLLHLPGHVRDVLDRLVWIVGSARGGTTVTGRALGSHPKHMFVNKITYFMEDVWSRHDKLSAEEVRKRVESTKYFDLERARANLPSSERILLNNHVDACFKSRNIVDIFKLFPLLRMIAEREGDAWPDYSCWQMKTNNWRGLNLIRDGFPDARFVFVLRDPRSNILSLSKRLALSAREDGGNRAGPSQIVEGALYWRTMASVMLAFHERHPDRSVLFRFEKFLDSPASELNKVFRDTTGSVVKEEFMTPLLETIRGGATNDDRERYQGISTKPKDRWRKELSFKEVALIETIVGRTAIKAGYDSGTQKKIGILLNAILSIHSPVKLIRTSVKLLVLPVWERFML